ncbi:MAG: SDR family oxidoreductase [Hyphomicrobiaceae bacterium]
MSKKTILIAGATGLVGYAAMKHFGSQPDCDVIAVSRRRPDETFGATFIAADLDDRDACQRTFGGMDRITHVVYAALYEAPGLVAGWQEAEQIARNDRMLRNLMDPLLGAAKSLRHVSLLQGTKAYGVHVRPMAVPAREGRSEARDIPNFYWNQEDYLRERQRGQGWAFSIFRPVLIVGFSTGSAMNLVPAIGVYGALLKAAGEPLYYPGGPDRMAQAIDADVLARAIGWAGDAEGARNEAFNVANGDVFTWRNVWPAIAEALGMPAGPDRSLSLEHDIAPRQAEWAKLAATHNLVEPDLKKLVGLSFQYADFQMGYGRPVPGAPTFSSTIKLNQAGFTEVIDTEVMFTNAIRAFQAKRLLPQP